MKRGQLLGALRRGVALGVGLAAAWGVWLTADPAALAQRFASPQAVVGLLAHQLDWPGEQRLALTGWGRLLLDQSALLAAGEEGVLDLRAERNTQPDPVPEDAEENDSQEPDLAPQTDPEGVVEMTARGKDTKQYLRDGGVYLYNRTGKELDSSVLTAGRVDVTMGEGPQILIVHTHGSEAYTQTADETYTESDPYRTTDCTRNVVRVGEEMAAVFRAHGFQVVHDTTLFDYPAYNGAYDRSGAAVEQWLQQYPTIQVVLDVHRDALVGQEGEVYKLVSQEGTAKVAQVMLVVGTDDAGPDHPRWKDNLAFALTLQRELVRGFDDLARPVVLRSRRYNQQLLPGSLLVEVGGHGNTLSEALAGARLWAGNVARTLLERVESGE